MESVRPDSAAGREDAKTARTPSFSAEVEIRAHDFACDGGLQDLKILCYQVARLRVNNNSDFQAACQALPICWSLRIEFGRASLQRNSTA